jgi:hemoglobin-like flavoprotein
VNAEQRALVRSTFETLRPIPKHAGVAFYERLFARDPALRRLFKGNIENQAAMFVTALNLAVLDLVEQGFVPPSVRALGVRHAGYGVEEAAYATFGEALLDTLGQLLGDRFTPEVREAWSEAYGELSAAMKESAGR